MAETPAHHDIEAGNLAETPPPPLIDIRVRPQAARGVNKRAIIIAAGGACIIILGLASLNLPTSPSQKPSQPALMMSAPARPEMAKGAVGGLPATYDQAAAFERARQPPPQLGPPLPGDVAAFAPEAPAEWHGADGAEAAARDEPDRTGNLEQAEAKRADRSDLFYALRAASAPAVVAFAAPTAQPPAAIQGSRATTSPVSTDPFAPDLAPDRALFAGTVIPASLLTALNSEAPGPVIAQVTQAVRDSATGRNTLIPQGARLIGSYRSAAKFGQSRLVILWSRLIMPDGSEITLDEPAIDLTGAAAIPGAVDDHWGDMLGAAALGTAINIGVASTEGPQIAYNGIGASTRDPVDQAVAEGIQRSASSVTSRVVDRSLALPPTIRVEAGKRIAVMVSRRLEL